MRLFGGGRAGTGESSDSEVGSAGTGPTAGAAGAAVAGAAVAGSRVAVIDCRDEPVAAPGECLDEAGRRRRIAEGLPQPLDRGIQAPFEIDEGAFRPQLVTQIFPCDQRPTLTKEDRQKPERLIGQQQPVSVVAQFSRLQVQLEVVEPHNLGAREGRGHVAASP